MACGFVGNYGVVFGTVIGERVLRRILEKFFRRVVSGILLSIGVLLLAASRQ